MSDLINRQDAIYALTEANLKSHMDSVEGGQENRSAIRIIMELPSAERKRGEWRYGENDIGIDGYWCTVCGEFVLWDYKGTIDFIHRYNYCPNCGSYMRGDDDE